MTDRVGFIALARATFDIPYAASTAREASELLGGIEGLERIGSPDLATSDDQSHQLLAGIGDIDALVVFQATFADSSLIASVSSEFDGPLVLWATPEPRTGERLRLNSFCGTNLAAYVLARKGVDYRWVYRSPRDPRAAQDLREALSRPGEAPATTNGQKSATSTLSLSGKKIGRVGDRPDGFEPCDYDLDQLRDVFGVSVDAVALSRWFESAAGVEHLRVNDVRGDLEAGMEGLDTVDQGALDRSLRLYLGLAELAGERKWDGVATRCWPECFTEFGGAACVGNSLLTSAGIPGCCEADVYGNVTALLLQEAAGSPALVADLVDLDRPTNSAVFWHCGLAPHEMAASKPRATVHSNRRLPLLNEFSLRPGRITIARVTQSRNRLGLAIGGAEMVDSPLPFAGTSGVAVLDTPVAEFLDSVMGAGLEHHYGVVYGDHREDLRRFAANHELDLIEL